MRKAVSLLIIGSFSKGRRRRQRERRCSRGFIFESRDFGRELWIIIHYFQNFQYTDI